MQNPFFKVSFFTVCYYIIIINMIDQRGLKGLPLLLTHKKMKWSLFSSWFDRLVAWNFAATVPNNESEGCIDLSGVSVVPFGYIYKPNLRTALVRPRRAGGGSHILWCVVCCDVAVGIVKRRRTLPLFVNV